MGYAIGRIVPRIVSCIVSGDVRHALASQLQIAPTQKVKIEPTQKVKNDTGTT